MRSDVRSLGNFVYVVLMGTKVTFSFVLVLSIGCGTSASTSVDSGTSNDGGAEVGNGDASSSSFRKIVFAADFDSNGGCADHSETDKCDLYTAQLNLIDGSVADIKRATDTAVSESYPALHPNGNVAYFSVFKDAKHKDLGYVDLTSGKTGVLKSDASWPAVHPTGTTLLYKDDTADTLIAAPLTGFGLTLGTGVALTGVKSQQDPDYSKDGRYVVFHEMTATDGAVGQVYDSQTQKTSSWGEASGHCGFGAGSLLTVCDNSKGGGLLAKTYQEGGSFGARSIFVADVKAEVLGPIDSVFAPCQGISFNYPTFCGDDQHVLVSTSCNQNGSVTFSRLFLIDLSGGTPTYRPIGKLLAESYKGPGKSSWTVSCLK